MPLPPRRLLGLLTLAATLSLLLAILTGSTRAGPSTILDLLGGNADALEIDILIRLRLMRALAALGTGACLALAGTFMQVLLRNPLADPYILGTSGGAAVGALAAITLGAGALFIDGAAFIGALVSTLLVFALARGSHNINHLLLTGVVVAAGWGALISLMLATSADTSLRGMLFWLMGDLGFAERPWPTLLVALIGGALGMALSRALDVLCTGDDQAVLLGVDVRWLRWSIYGLAALLTGTAVTTAGTVGFVGLIIPHLVRIVGGSSHRVLVPGAALAGGTLLVLADTLSRTVLAPRQLPVGAVMAVVGVPVFLLLLHRGTRSGS